MCILAMVSLLLVDDKDNLIENGGFEKVKDGKPEVWTQAGTSEGGKLEIAASDAKPKTGKNCLRIKGNAEWACCISNKIKTEKGKVYLLKGNVRTQKGTGYVKFDYFKDDEYLGMTMNEQHGVDRWMEMSLTSELENYPGATHISATLVGGEGEFEVDFDDVSIVLKK
jgi:hypothetical protein